MSIVLGGGIVSECLLMITWIICWALGSRGKVGREFVYRMLDYRL